MNSNQNWVLYSGAPITVWQAFSNGMGVLQVGWACVCVVGVRSCSCIRPHKATARHGGKRSTWTGDTAIAMIDLLCDEIWASVWHEPA